MIINLKFFASLRQYMPGDKDESWVDVQMESTVGEVLDYLKVPPDKPKIYMVNGVHAERETLLKEGDVLSVFPPVAGG